MGQVMSALSVNADKAELRHGLVAKLSGQTQLWCMITPTARQTIHPENGCELLDIRGWWSQTAHTKPPTIQTFLV